MKLFFYQHPRIRKGLIVGGVTLSLCACLKYLYFRGGVCRVEKDLTGKVAVITGGNAGIGKQTVIKLAQKGCKIVMGSRDTFKSQQLVQRLRKQYKNQNILQYRLDLSSKESIKQFSDKVNQQCDKIDFMINNAGVAGSPTRRVTVDGLEMTIGVNHFGHFYLNYLLWDKIKQSQNPRIVVVSSIGHRKRGSFLNLEDVNIEKGYYMHDAYVRSKQANVLYSKLLQKKINEAKINCLVVSLHPGIIYTQIFDGMVESRMAKVTLKIASFLIYPLIWTFCKSTKQGAQTTLYTIFQDKQKLTPGGYYSDAKLNQCDCLAATDPERAEKLWKISQDLLGIKFNL